MPYDVPPVPSGEPERPAQPVSADPYAAPRPPPPPAYGQPDGYSPPPPPQQPPPAYGYPPAPVGYGYPAQQQTSGKATTIMVLGILSLVLCMVLGIVALVMAPGARAEIAASQGRLGGESQIKAGVICSWVSIGLAIAGIVVALAIVVIGVSLGGTSN